MACVVQLRDAVRDVSFRELDLQMIGEGGDSFDEVDGPLARNII